MPLIRWRCNDPEQPENWGQFRYVDVADVHQFDLVMDPADTDRRSIHHVPRSILRVIALDHPEDQTLAEACAARGISLTPTT